MPGQNRTLTAEYGGETMDRELQLKFKGNLVISFLDGEGLVFETETRKTFWVNETAVFLLRLLEANREGVPFSSAISLLQEHYFTDDGNKITQDFTSFLNQLEGFGLISLQSPSNRTNGAKLKNPNGGLKKPYLKPLIEEERDILVITETLGGAYPGPWSIAQRTG